MSSRIIIIADRSGSMAGNHLEMEAAINAFIEDQKGFDDGLATLKLVQFDHEYEVSYEGALRHAPAYSLKPRGSTALHDAIGRTLGTIDPATLQAELKTVVVVVTDGYENASQEWDGPRVRELVTKLDASPNFAITYLGANQDAVLEATRLGFTGDAALTFANNAAGAQNSLRSVSSSVASYLSGATSGLSYSSSDREAAMGETQGRTETETSQP